MYKNRKPLIMAVLCALIVVMAIGFALLQQELTITGTSHIDSNWNIRITNIRVKNLNSGYASGSNAAADVSGSTGCTTQTAPCNSTTANFEAKLVTPGDYIVYEVTITNSGTLDGVVASINLSCSENDNITCTTTGLERADTIAKTNGTNTVDVKVEYNSSTSSQPVNTSVSATLTINYQQDLGQVEPDYDYRIGQKIENYKGSDWYVIKNSTASEDYVTLIKETVLTGTEIGANYVYGGDTSRNYNMAYYWSSTCHYSVTYGSDVYSSDDASGCSGHNDYAGSKIKEVVDNYMTTNIMTNDLKEVDGYKIRLITTDELSTNLGWTSGIGTSAIAEGNDVPTWVYQDFGSRSIDYWTMTPSNIVNGVRVYIVSLKNKITLSNEIHKGVNSGRGYSYRVGVRPVINLLKSAIPAQS